MNFKHNVLFPKIINHQVMLKTQIIPPSQTLSTWSPVIKKPCSTKNLVKKNWFGLISSDFAPKGYGHTVLAE